MCMYICSYIFTIVLSGEAPIINGMATVTVNELECNATYSIQAGGKFNDSLLGPRSSSYENITTDICVEEKVDIVARKTDDGGIKSLGTNNDVLAL